jgi:hypothetical protein
MDGNATKDDSFSEYAEKHGLYDLFQRTVEKLVISRPVDPYQFMIDAFSKSREGNF